MLQLFYENNFHKIITTTPKYYSVDSTFIPTGKIHKSDQAVLCKFWEGDIVGYNDDYYKVVSEKHNNRIPYQPITHKTRNGTFEIYYMIRLFVDKNTTTGRIEDNPLYKVNQNELIALTQKDKENIRSTSINLLKYNTSIFNASTTKGGWTREWMNRAFDTNNPPCLLSLPETMRLIEKTKINKNKLMELGRHIRQTHRSDLQLMNVVSNPFRFITPEWQLFVFDTACNIADIYNITIDPITKMEAWIYSYVHQEKRFYILCNKMEVDYEKKKYKIWGKAPRSLLSNEILKEKTIDGVLYYTTEYLMNLEKELGDLMVKLFHEKEISLGISDEQIHEFIYDFENETDSNGVRIRFKLNEEQRSAVQLCLRSRFAVITGFPGTGKSTIMECVFYIRARINQLDNISISAPTGLAYKNIYDKLSNVKVGEKKIILDDSASGTTHKCVYINFPNIINNRQREQKREQDITTNIRKYYKQRENIEREIGMTNIQSMLIDEISMLDIYMFKRVLENCKKFDCQLILIGDSNQLPSVGPGAVLKSIVDSGIFNDNIVTLNRICRQSSGALLKSILTMANGGIITGNDFDNSSLYFSPIREYEGDKFISRLYHLFETHSLTKENTKVICFYSNSKLQHNTEVLNTVLQTRYNPNGTIIRHPYDKGMVFKVGDSILLTSNNLQVNNHESEIYRVNGDEAVILSFDSNMVKIRYNTDPETEFTTISTTQLYGGEYMLSYALTVHKAQGSQYDNIVFIPGCSPYVTKELIFTAISRAKEKCFVLSDMVQFINLQKKITKKPTIFMNEFLDTKFE